MLHSEQLIEKLETDDIKLKYNMLSKSFSSYFLSSSCLPLKDDTKAYRSFTLDNRPQVTQDAVVMNLMPSGPGIQ